MTNDTKVCENGLSQFTRFCLADCFVSCAKDILEFNKTVVFFVVNFDHLKNTANAKEGLNDFCQNDESVKAFKEFCSVRALSCEVFAIEYDVYVLCNTDANIVEKQVQAIKARSVKQ